MGVWEARVSVCLGREALPLQDSRAPIAALSPRLALLRSIPFPAVFVLGNPTHEPSCLGCVGHHVLRASLHATSYGFPASLRMFVPADSNSLPVPVSTGHSDLKDFEAGL